MKLYIAGPMDGYPEHNFPAFAEAAAKLRAVGYEVVSPHEQKWNEDLTHPREWYLRQDFPLICTVDGIALLDGWEHSIGSNRERTVGEFLAIPSARVSWWLGLRDGTFAVSALPPPFPPDVWQPIGGYVKRVPTNPW